MLTSLKIKGFRKYKVLELKKFSKINFILGQNNVGKTSVLEAVFNWACGQNILPIIKIIVNRCGSLDIQPKFLMIEEISSVFHNRENLPFKMRFSGIYNGQ